ncbi:alpha-tectorin-like [Cheilinus undulatus]|uniref:alpha-tectorin-like n=1 Tax=Cheilinus undulatus TaxID=241271 RepID=UPI001BD3A3F4|nr:alpha-tectorin-like [Cheilinus undulatus]
MQKGTEELTLTETPKEFGKLKISKTDKGVTVLYSEKNVDVSVFFDGYTAQIDVKGPPSTKVGLKDLCANADPGAKGVALTTGSCKDSQTESVDPSVDCNKIKKSCGILKNAPFTSCHSHINPDSFIKACEQTLCKYPAVDGLPCSYLEAYARACSLYSNEDVKGWRATAGCPTSPKAFCQDKVCDTNEFCGENQNKDGFICFCRSIFAAPYRLKNSMGDPTACAPNSAKATLINCLLVEKGVDYQTLHLNDQSCKGELKDGVVTFSFNKAKMCGTKVTDTDKEVFYKNTIQAAGSGELIVRQAPVNIDFSCNFVQPEMNTMTFKVTGGSESLTTEVESGSWKYEITLKAYADEALKTPVGSVELNQRIWISLQSTGLDANSIAVFINSCWATKVKNAEADPKYYLIQNGCKNPKDDSMILEGNGKGTSSLFSFKVFKFPKSNDGVYMHCRIKMCGKDDANCLPNCTKKGGRRRRSSSSKDDGATAYISMSWTS